jgi:hypothetical protein
MILKYAIAAAIASSLHSDLSGSTALRDILGRMFGHVLDCLQDADDDVRQMASASLEPVSARLNELLDNDTDKLQRLMRILVDVLSDLDDLGECHIFIKQVYRKRKKQI